MISARTINTSASIIAPPPRLKISEWADRFAYIPSEGNAEPGKYRLSRMPHQQAMLDDPMDPAVRESFWMMASQAAGKTLVLILISEFIIEQLRKSIIMVRTTRETAMDWMRDKFLPTARATPCMEGLLKDPRERDSESTSLNRKFPGGSIKVLGAKSPAAFRGTSAPNIFQDEIDSYVAIKEGDASALADRAAITFTDAWKIKASTPTLEGFSRIAEGHDRGDKQLYFIPCPCCGGYQALAFDQLKFTFTHQEYARFPVAAPPAHVPFEAVDELTANSYEWIIAPSGSLPVRDTRRAIYVCVHCKRGWTDAQRIAAYMSGHPDNPPVIPRFPEQAEGHRTPAPCRAHWKATAPFNGIRSRQLSGMYLTIGLTAGMENYLHQFAEQFLEAKHGGRETLMVWTNIFKSEPFEDAHEKLDWQTIKDRAEDYHAETELPVEVMFIIFGGDVHPDRVEITTYGFGSGQEVWAIEHVVHYGDFDMPEMQDRVEDYLLNRRFNHPVWGQMDIRAGGIDSGHQTKVKAVYHFCKKHGTRNFWAVKGFDDPLGSLYTSTMEKRLRLARFNLNTGHLKSYIYDRLKNTKPGPNYIHFPLEEVTAKVKDPKTGVVTVEKRRTSFTSKFYQQLCSERRFPERQKDGSVIYRWRKLASSARNEALDNAVYAFGVFEIVKQVGYIERRWAETLKILHDGGSKIGGEPPRATAPSAQRAKKEYVIKPASEAKLPDLKVEASHAHKPNRQRPAAARRPARRGGGFFNPLGL